MLHTHQRYAPRPQTGEAVKVSALLPTTSTSSSSACWFFFPHFLPLKSLHPLVIVTIRYMHSIFSFFLLSHLCSFSPSLVPLPMLPIVIRLQSALIPQNSSPNRHRYDPSRSRPIYISFQVQLLLEINSEGGGCLSPLLDCNVSTFVPFFPLGRKPTKKEQRLKRDS